MKIIDEDFLANEVQRLETEIKVIVNCSQTRSRFKRNLLHLHGNYLKTVTFTLSHY
jgi:hypothetical protein